MCPKRNTNPLRGDNFSEKTFFEPPYRTVFENTIPHVFQLDFLTGDFGAIEKIDFAPHYWTYLLNNGMIFKIQKVGYSGQFSLHVHLKSRQFHATVLLGRGADS